MNTTIESISAALGKDPFLTQGAGGNTSTKTLNVLSVKASGKWLSQASEDQIFVELNLAETRDAVHAGIEVDLNSLGLKKDALRASIEAPVHAIIPDSVVLHIHSLRTLAYAVQVQGKELISEKLKNFKWTWIEYVKPGWPLAFAIRDSLSSNPNVWILENHGLIVSGETVDKAYERLLDVEKALGLQPRKLIDSHKFDLGKIDQLGFRLPKYSGVHALAQEEKLIQLLGHGILYPDQAVFLGDRFFITDSIEKLGECPKELPVVMVRGFGVLIRKEASIGVDEMLNCHVLLGSLLPDDVKLRSLKAPQIAELLNWDAEKYRQSLNKSK